MCNNETHYELIPSAHVTSHAMEVQRQSSMIRFGREGASVEEAEANAYEALELARSNPELSIDVVCVHFLETVLKGGLRGEQLPSAS